MQDRPIRRHTGGEAGYRAEEAVTTGPRGRTGLRQVVIRLDTGRRSAVDEQAPGNEPVLERSGEIIEDLEPDERESETVLGGGIAGETQASNTEKWIELNSFKPSR